MPARNCCQGIWLLLVWNNAMHGIPVPSYLTVQNGMILHTVLHVAKAFQK